MKIVIMIIIIILLSLLLTVREKYNQEKTIPKIVHGENINVINNFFEKVYVINLFDNYERWKKMKKQFDNHGIKVDRFIALDGRCKGEGDEGCLAKLNTFEMSYNIKISNKNNLPLCEIIPAASLTIGTILILRNMVAKKYNHILICEDDIELGRGFEKNFKRGINELKGTKHENWDVLYLGCGNRCGDNGISKTQTREINHISTLNQFYGEGLYSENPNDLRSLCGDDCKRISPHMSVPAHSGGSWCYAFSLKGAKKFLKLIDNDVGNHVDQIYQNLPNNGGIIPVAFNPPIVWHEGGAARSDTNIPWEY